MNQATDTDTGQDAPVDLEDALAQTVNEQLATDEDVNEVVAAKEPEPEAPEVTETPEEVAPVETVGPPPSWTPEQRALFDQIAQLGQEGTELTPVDVQKFVVDLYKGEQSRASKAVEERHQLDTQIKELNGALEPLNQQWQLDGISQQQGLSRLVQFESWVRTDPENAVMWLAQQAGVNLEQAFYGREQVDPNTQRLESEVLRLKSEQQQWQDRQFKAEVDQTIAMVRQFETAVDDSGNLVHPYFSDVKETMIGLAKAGAVRDVEEAYQIACMTTPGVKERYQDDLSRAQAAAQAAPQTAPAAVPEPVDKGGQRIKATGSQSADPASPNPVDWEAAIEETVNSY